MTQFDIDKAIWFQEDAAFVYLQASECRKSPEYAFIAVRMQQNAAHSAAMARGILNITEE
jgi:hypothetical protein